MLMGCGMLWNFYEKDHKEPMQCDLLYPDEKTKSCGAIITASWFEYLHANNFT